MALNLVGWNVVLDSDNADKLSAFYEKLLGWTRFPGEEFTVLATTAVDKITKQRHFHSSGDYLSRRGQMPLLDTRR